MPEDMQRLAQHLSRSGLPVVAIVVVVVVAAVVVVVCYSILYYTILYYTILYYTILYYTILYYTILYYTILYYTMYSTPYSDLLESTLRPHLLVEALQELVAVVQMRLVDDLLIKKKQWKGQLCLDLV